MYCWFWVFLWVACQSEEPPVPRATLVEILVELHLASGFAATAQPTPQLRDSVARPHYAQILAQNGVSVPDFLATLSYYEARPQELEAVYSEVIQSLTLLQEQVAPGTVRADEGSESSTEKGKD